MLSSFPFFAFVLFLSVQSVLFISAIISLAHAFCDESRKICLGRMFPSIGELHLALFSDEALFIEQSAKANFWCQDSFHGVNLSSLRPQALVEIFKQPVVVRFQLFCVPYPKAIRVIAAFFERII